MKKGKKKVEFDIIPVCVENLPLEYCLLHNVQSKYTYLIETSASLDTQTLELFVEVDVPETLAEFRQMNNLSKEELTEWLNKKYKHR